MLWKKEIVLCIPTKLTDHKWFATIAMFARKNAKNIKGLWVMTETVNYCHDIWNLSESY